MDISGSQSAAATSNKASSPSVVVDETSTTKDASTTKDTSTTKVAEQKRVRVERACDVCRHKKIKCDGKRPCKHCVGYTDGGQYSANNAELRSAQFIT